MPIGHRPRRALYRAAYIASMTRARAHPSTFCRTYFQWHDLPSCARRYCNCAERSLDDWSLLISW